MTDLFGRPIYDSPPARQRPLFSARNWFHAGYTDATAGCEAPLIRGVAAYNFGFEAGRRDLAAGTLDEARAWRANLACGNVTED
jgi:hypothetical protein